MYTGILVFFAVFLINRNIISKIKISKVTDFAALSSLYTDSEFLLISCSAQQNMKGVFQICPRMDFDNILYVEYLGYNNYKHEIILFLKSC